ncbi:Crp/Fnr family transcriptional regulator [Marinilabilia salmonicolor]|jgi:CRP-like cAMP-binding protein|uniref:CRP-like cAMP-binding protein n=1 Tax=Marinilabilia salmonicolor TaxID=989 RepID=A0A2T0X652_9BACT|nr:Crp/Fnr family transcriptional regulator [Marinilabilia salmonicolor]PRY94403.1 CRP-like cAMP-binding protein [Marinilabilia salmonicolor]RCW29999.1 CRP-like cAMP-binding protein [Marinilabilia salmonicolor]
MENKLIYYIRKWTDITREKEADVYKAFETISVKKKQKLLIPGDTCKYIYFITQGALRSWFVDDKGVEHIYQIRLENGWISDLESFFSQRPSKYYIEALEDSKLLRISYERLEALYIQVPSLERYFRILFQKAYINALERLNSTMWESAVDRYNNMMKENKDIFQRVPLVYIASYLGITPESLSRIRKKRQV